MMSVGFVPRAPCKRRSRGRGGQSSARPAPQSSVHAARPGVRPAGPRGLQSVPPRAAAHPPPAETNVFPINDENPTELRPWMTVLILLANVAAWLLLQGGGATPVLEQSVAVFGAQPCEITATCPVSGLGRGAIVTSIFMHGSWMHLIGNMLFLWVFGNNIEDSMGHLRFLVFYLVCGVAAALAQIFFAPASEIPIVGASGAISGIMGAYILLYPRARVRTYLPPIFIFHLRAFWFLLYWFVMQLLSGFLSLGMTEEEGGVAVWAHVGGFVAGLLLIRLFDRPRLVQAKRHGVHLSRDEVAELRW